MTTAAFAPLQTLANTLLPHYQTKLLHLADGFQTNTGQRLSRIRHERLKGFMELFKEEIGIC